MKGQTLNRTILELKLIEDVIEECIVILLIAPYWNWNWITLKLTQHRKLTLNRTILELKLGYRFRVIIRFHTLNRTILELKHRIEEQNKKNAELLIAPYWNWNLKKTQRDTQSDILLIAPYWNWNMDAGCLSVRRRYLLIAPYWNWNIRPIKRWQTN